MRIRKSVALVTGANRGLGRAYAQALLDAGAAKVYAAARDPGAVSQTGVTVIRLDVTDPASVAAAAAIAGDAQIVVNNAGIAEPKPLLGEDGEAALRGIMEINLYGILSVSRSFAPALKAAPARRSDRHVDRKRAGPVATHHAGHQPDAALR
ncbi:MAG: SDR family NAD(P)-dependent oxidoreductase, partial [Hyphomicrobiales bacterium]|nr:SDR family NAD(P)-dependent oxidoreductase [Hyphomicrobiales bacterium]